MKTLIFVLAGVLSGYIIGNLETKEIEEIIEDLLLKGDRWLEVIQIFIGETVEGLEEVDSDKIKMNVDAFINALTESVEEFAAIDNFSDRVNFIEKRITLISSDLLEKSKKIESE